MQRNDIRLKNGLLFRRIVDEGLLLDIENDVGYRLNRVGTHILQLLQEGSTGEELAARLCTEFDIDEQRCSLEIHEFLQQLDSAGLLRPA